jgi:hypothetical protein
MGFIPCFCAGVRENILKFLANPGFASCFARDKNVLSKYLKLSCKSNPSQIQVEAEHEVEPQN